MTVLSIVDITVVLCTCLGTASLHRHATRANPVTEAKSQMWLSAYCSIVSAPVGCCFDSCNPKKAESKKDIN